MICSSVNLLFFMSVLPLKTDSTNLQLVRPMGSRSDQLALEHLAMDASSRFGCALGYGLYLYGHDVHDRS